MWGVFLMGMFSGIVAEKPRQEKVHVKETIVIPPRKPYVYKLHTPRKTENDR